MARIYDTIDLFWSSDGDFSLDHRGDIQDTSFDPLRSIHQQIETRIKGDPGDWALNQDIGAGLSRYVGMRNTRQVGTEIKSSINENLLRDGLIDPRDLKVKVAPIAPELIAVKVDLLYQKTRSNQDSLPVTKLFVYDYRDNNVYPTDNKFSAL